MLRCAFAVILFFSLLVSGLFAAAGEPTLGDHVTAQTQTQTLANAYGEDSAGKHPAPLGETSTTEEADAESCALCNSMGASLTFGPKPAIAIPFTPVLFLQPYPDGLRRPPRAAAGIA